MTSLDIFSFVSADDALQMLRGWLRTERQRLRWTQAELARRSGVPAAKGTPVEDADVLIAATALVHGMPVATGNVRHFECFPGLEVLEW